MALDSEIRQTLAGLSRGPATLAGLVNRAPDGAWDFVDPDRGGWSAREIVAHLADMEFNLHYTARVARILTEDRPQLCAAESDWRALEHRHRQQDPRVALGAYTMARKHMVAVLTGVPPEAWDRMGVHPESGERTLLEIAQGFARHEQRHLARAAELLERAAARPAR